MEKALTLSSLALENLRRKRYRTAALVAVIALATAVLFGSLILISSLKAGIYGIQSRIGADLMVVPEGYESKVENVLLSGEPNYFYLDKSIEEIVRGIQGVEGVTSQFYLTSLTESCCDFPVQIIGFNTEDDFIVKNWAKSRYKKTPGEEVIFAGSNVTLEKKTVRFFDGTHTVLSKLAKSGTGMDNAIYADLPTLQNIFEDALSKGFGFISDGDTRTKTSVILVKLAEGAGADGVSLKIKTAAPGVQVIQRSRFVSTLTQKLSGFLIFLYALCVLVVVIGVLTLSVVFSLTLNERLKEFSILRVLGADHGKLRCLVISESVILGLAGAVAGILAVLIFVLPFNVVISEKIGLPFALSSPSQTVYFALLVLLVSVLTTVVASASSIVRISKFEPYEESK